MRVTNDSVRVHAEEGHVTSQEAQQAAEPPWAITAQPLGRTIFQGHAVVIYQPPTRLSFQTPELGYVSFLLGLWDLKSCMNSGTKSCSNYRRHWPGSELAGLKVALNELVSQLGGGEGRVENVKTLKMSLCTWTTAKLS